MNTYTTIVKQGKDFVMSTDSIIVIMTISMTSLEARHIQDALQSLQAVSLVLSNKLILVRNVNLQNKKT